MGVWDDRKCVDCEKETSTIYGKERLCCDCHTKREEISVEKKAQEYKSCVSFKDWTGKDLSRLFFVTFGKYQKEPSQDKIEIIYLIWLWACHDNHALSTAIAYTFRWADNFDIMYELHRWKN